MRSEQEINRAVELYSDTLKRICVLYLKNAYDTGDIFQEVFLKYALSSVLFENPQHEKAWIIRVTIYQCKDFLKSFMRKQSVPIEDIVSVTYPSETGCPDVLEAVLSLPQKYKDVIYLHYYEGYSAAEISKILGKNVNTVYTLTARAKDKLKAKLGGCEIE